MALKVQIVVEINIIIIRRVQTPTGRKRFEVLNGACYILYNYMLCNYKELPVATSYELYNWQRKLAYYFKGTCLIHCL